MGRPLAWHSNQSQAAEWMRNVARRISYVGPSSSGDICVSMSISETDPHVSKLRECCVSGLPRRWSSRKQGGLCRALSELCVASGEG